MLLMLASVGWANPVVAVVVVDREAREAGYALEIDGFVVDEALPVGVEDGAVLHLLDPRGETEPLDVARGEAWQIAGPSGEAWMAVLGEDVRTDRIVVRGDADAIAALAAELGARTVVEGEVTMLAGDGVLLAAAKAHGALGRAIDEASLVATPGSAAKAVDPAVDPPAGTARAPAGASASARPAPLPASPSTRASSGAADATPLPRRGKKDRLPHDPRATGADAAIHYAGVHLCGDSVLALSPSGVFSVAGERGSWRVSSPGVVRMEAVDGTLLFRAAFHDDGRCRAVWAEPASP